MFDQTFVRTGKTRTGWTVTAGFLAEIAAVGVMVLVPLIWTDVLPKAQYETLLLAPAPPPPPPAPPPAPAPVRQNRGPVRRIEGNVLRAPVMVPRQVPMIVDSPQAPTIEPGAARPGATLAVLSGVPGGVLALGSAPPPVMPPPQKPQPASVSETEGPFQVGGEVQKARLLKSPAPVYPSLAKAARIQGVVVLRAIVAKDGTIRNLTPVNNASPLLVRAAVAAVSQWVYRPTYLDGVPVEVKTEITVNFALQ